MVSTIKTLSITRALYAIGLASVIAPVCAQQNVSPDADDVGNALDEIIVTAQRKSENVQDVPISMTVISEEQIANANMTNSSDLTTLTPSLAVDTRFGYENASFTIRGFYQSLRTTASVATYFADVVAPRGQTAQTSGDGAGPGYLFDLQNIQVLKGPQGTLFGRNTTGGAILLVPQEPTDAFEGYVEGSVGNFDAKRVQTVINAPVTETFRVRLGVDSNQRDGYLNNITGIGADKLGNSDYTATRLSLLWDITDSIENYTIFQYVDSETAGYTSILFACNPGGLNGARCLDQLQRQTENGHDGFYDLASTVNTPISTIEEKRVINTTSWSMTDDITLKNIFGYAHLKTKNGSNVFGTDFPDTTDPSGHREFSVGTSVVNSEFPVTSQESYVEEIQFQGSSFEESLDWQAGLYFEHSRPDGFSGNNTAGFLNCDPASTESSDPAQFDCYDPFNGAIGGSVLIQKYKTEFLNKAIYGQATYDFTNAFSITAGLRYTKDEAKGFGIKERYVYHGITQQPVIRTESHPKVTDEKPTGMIEASYHPAEDIMTYAKYTRGYRQGSVNLAADPGLDEHGAETIDSYEIGAKTAFGGPIPGQFNIAIFDNELTDMQLMYGYLSDIGGATAAITNAGKAVSRGVEMDTNFRLTDDLTLSLSYSHLDTELKATGDISPEEVAARVTAATGNPAYGAKAASAITPISDEGDELPFAPLNNWVASLNYLLPVPADIGVIGMGTTYVYTGTQRVGGSSSTIYDMLPSYELLNLNASWMNIYASNIDVSLFVTNALDKEFEVNRSNTYNLLGFESRMNGMPRMYGARLRYSFGG